MQACTAHQAMQRPACSRPPHAAAAHSRPQLVRPRHSLLHPSIQLVQYVSQESVTAAASTSQQQTAEGPQALHPEAWLECVEFLTTTLGFDEFAAGTCVQRAFGWGAKARSYWRHEKRDEVPSLQQIEAVLDFLHGLGMDELQVAKTVKAFPEVLGCAVDSQLQGNVAQLQKEWKLEGDVLRGAVLRNPPLLGYNVDCLGDCAGECNRCWVRF